MVFKKYILLLVLLTSINNFCSNKKEIFTTKVSFLLEQSDSILLNKKLINLKELYKDKKYYEATQIGLSFLDDKDLNSFYKYEVNIILGDIFRRNNNSQKSIFHFKKALSIILNTNSGNLETKKEKSYTTTLGELYLKIGNRYLSIKKIDSAEYYYNNILNRETLRNQDLSFKASAFSNLSGIYRQDSLFDKAKIFALKAVEIHRKRNNKISEAVSLGNLASIYIDLDNFKDAKTTYKKALDLIEFDKSDRALRVKEKLYFNLAFNLYKLKDYEAYIYQEKSYLLKDSLRDKEIRKIIEELDFKYDFDSKKKLILEKEKNKRLEDKATFFIIFIIAGIIILSLVYFLKLKSLKQKNLELSLEKTKLEKNKQLDNLKSELQAKILNATIDGKESERKKIAETLHDNVSALLSSANLHLQATKKQFNGATPLEIDKTQSIIKEATHKIRDLSHTLVSSILLRFGLEFALKDLVDKCSNSELKIKTEFKDLKRYEQSFEIKVYNMINEFINNIIKHSKAKNAVIKLKEENSCLYLSIKDDGIGFNKSNIQNKDGLGINQIDARIQMMKGNFTIDSSENKGVDIHVRIPVVEIEETNYVSPIQ